MTLMIAAIAFVIDVRLFCSVSDSLFPDFMDLKHFNFLFFCGVSEIEMRIPTYPPIFLSLNSLLFFAHNFHSFLSVHI